MQGFKALIFDFNGIVIDDEPLHFRLFQELCRQERITLSKRDYYTQYLGYDDKGSFEAIYRDNGRPLSPQKLQELIEEKTVRYDHSIKEGIRVFPGVIDLIHHYKTRLPLAIVSGALRREIVAVTGMLGIADAFQEIVSANETQFSKPNPEGYIKAFEALAVYEEGLQAGDCLAIEDSIAGIEAAKGAGMRCLAVTNSYSASELTTADWVCESLEGLRLEDLIVETH